jgi:hypothetical protein
MALKATSWKHLSMSFSASHFFRSSSFWISRKLIHKSDEKLKQTPPELTFGAGPDDTPTTVALRPEFQRDRLSQQSPEEVLQIYIIWNLS